MTYIRQQLNWNIILNSNFSTQWLQTWMFHLQNNYLFENWWKLQIRLCMIRHFRDILYKENYFYALAFRFRLSDLSPICTSSVLINSRLARRQSHKKDWKSHSFVTWNVKLTFRFFLPSLKLLCCHDNW
jgi:hypothetical protein